MIRDLTEFAGQDNAIVILSLTITIIALVILWSGIRYADKDRDGDNLGNMIQLHAKTLGEISTTLNRTAHILTVQNEILARLKADHRSTNLAVKTGLNNHETKASERHQVIHELTLQAKRSLDETKLVLDLLPTSLQGIRTDVSEIKAAQIKTETELGKMTATLLAAIKTADSSDAIKEILDILRTLEEAAKKAMAVKPGNGVGSIMSETNEVKT